MRIPVFGVLLFVAPDTHAGNLLLVSADLPVGNKQVPDSPGRRTLSGNLSIALLLPFKNANKPVYQKKRCGGIFFIKIYSLSYNYSSSLIPPYTFTTQTRNYTGDMPPR